MVEDAGMLGAPSQDRARPRIAGRGEVGRRRQLKHRVAFDGGEAEQQRRDDQAGTAQAVSHYRHDIDGDRETQRDFEKPVPGAPPRNDQIQSGGAEDDNAADRGGRARPRPPVFPPPTPHPCCSRSVVCAFAAPSRPYPARAARYSRRTMSKSSSAEVVAAWLSKVTSPCWISITRSQISSVCA